MGKMLMGKGIFLMRGFFPNIQGIDLCREREFNEDMDHIPPNDILRKEKPQYESEYLSSVESLFKGDVFGDDEMRKLCRERANYLEAKARDPMYRGTDMAATFSAEAYYLRSIDSGMINAFPKHESPNTFKYTVLCLIQDELMKELVGSKFEPSAAVRKFMDDLKSEMVPHDK